MELVPCAVGGVVKLMVAGDGGANGGIAGGALRGSPHGLSGPAIRGEGAQQRVGLEDAAGAVDGACGSVLRDAGADAGERAVVHNRA